MEIVELKNIITEYFFKTLVYEFNSGMKGTKRRISELKHKTI